MAFRDHQGRDGSVFEEQRDSTTDETGEAEVATVAANGAVQGSGATLLTLGALVLFGVAATGVTAAAPAGGDATGAGPGPNLPSPTRASVPAEDPRNLSCPAEGKRMILKNETKTVLTERNSITIRGGIETYRGADQYRYCPSISADTALIKLVMDGRLDADLYVTTDGREPTGQSYDKRSARSGRGVTETIALDICAETEQNCDLGETSEIRIQVKGYDGVGEYELVVSEKRAGVSTGPGTGTPTPSGGTVGDFQATITANATAVATGETVEFRATSTGGADVTYRWSFGDGTTATGRTVTHAYGGRGSYTVELTATKPDGTTDTATKQILVGTVASSGAGSGGPSTTTVVAGAGGAAVLGGVAYFLFRG